MRELRMHPRLDRDTIANGADSRHVRPVLAVDSDVALVHLYPDAVGVQAGGHRRAAGRDEEVVRPQLPAGAVGELHVDVDGLAGHLRASHPGAGVTGNTLLAKR